ncbi:8021_t:CDS:2 [Funneliformis geosporum]|nr:8021_t:CDS:2 [Funneliformis geosporum]
MDAKREIILAIKNFQKQVEDKLLSGRASKKIVVFNKRVENAISKLSSEVRDFQEEGQMTLLREKLEKSVKQVEGMIKVSKHNFSSESSSLNPKAKKELENLFFANTIRDFSFDPESVLVKNKTEEIFQKVEKFNKKKANSINKRKQFKSKFFDNKSEILSFNEETGMDSGDFNAAFFDSRPLLSEGELDEDIEEITSTVRNDVKKFKKVGQNKPETEKNNNKKPLSEIEGWNSLSPHDRNKFSADYESGSKDFEKIKLEIERQRKGEKVKEKTNNENSKNKPSTPPKQKNKEKTTAGRQQKLSQKKNKVITEINSALNQEPQLTNSELSPEYQNWESQINQITDIQQITHLQDRILADIKAHLEEQETEKGYNDNKEEIENLKKEKATNNPQEYGEEAKKRIADKLKSCGVNEEELSNENQQVLKKLRNDEINDPDRLVAAETEIKQNIYQVAAEKKIVDLTTRVNKILQAKDKSQLATLKKELLQFISSSNIYYTSHKKEVKSLLAKLENYSTNNQQSNNQEQKEYQDLNRELNKEEQNLLLTEIKSLENKKAELINQIKEQIIGEEGDSQSILMEIRPGPGGDEAGLFVRDLYRMYEKFAGKKGWKVEMVEGKVGAIVGVHRVQRIPVTAKGGEIHTSTATVVVLPEPQDIVLNIRSQDLKVETYSSGGPGGQHANRTASAVRITHLPTKIIATSQDGRDQRVNRERALLVLKTRLLEKLQAEKEKEVGNLRSFAIGTAERSENFRTYNFQKNRVTDKRLGIKLENKLEFVIEGGLEEICQRSIDYEVEKRII